jgi:alkenylglycerophosphocholine/alkenylglycerophosphoethanolamine hydrolase
LVFSLDVGWAVSPWLLLPWVIYAIVLLVFLLPHAGPLKGPVVLYGVAITAMAWRGLERWALVGEESALLVLVGAILFVLSDSPLAIHRFVCPFKAVHAVVLGTCYTAQWLIALSV